MDDFIKRELFNIHNKTNEGFNEVLKVCKEIKSDIPMHSENEKRLNSLVESTEQVLHQINVSLGIVFERYRLFLDEV